MVNKKLLQELGQYTPFDNCEWQIRVRGSTDHDKRTMTFVDNLWGFEVTGGTLIFFITYNIEKNKKNVCQNFRNRSI